MVAITNFSSWVNTELSLGRRWRVLAMGGMVGVTTALLMALVSNAASPAMAGLGIVGATLACGMMLSPTFAVLALCFSIPFERIGRFTNDSDAVAVSLSRILGVIALLSLLLHMVLRKRKLHFGRPFLLYAAYTLVGLLSYVWAYSPDETFRDCLRVLGNLVFFFLIVNVIRSYRHAKIAALVWLVASMTSGVYSLVNYYYFRSSVTTEASMGLTANRFSTVESDAAEARSLGMNVLRFYGTTAHPALFGLNMTMAVPFFLWAIRVRRRFLEKLFWTGGLLVAVVCVFLSNTRGVTVLIAFTIAFCIWRGLLRLRAQTAVGLLIVGLIVAAVIPQDVYRRSLNFSLYTTDKADSLRVRFKFWEKSWELVEQSWPLGIGLGDQTTLLKTITDEDTGYLTSVGARASAHNEYIWVLVEVGLLGYLFHWWFVAVATRASFGAGRLFQQQGANEQRLFAIACQVLMVGVLLLAFQSEVFHYPLKSWWLVAALSCNLLEFARSPQVSLGRPGLVVSPQ